MIKTQRTYVADERLYLTEDNRVVGADDPRRLTLLVTPGASLPWERAVELGLVKAGKGKADGGGTEEGDEDGDETAIKAADAPPQTKMISAPKGKK